MAKIQINGKSVDMQTDSYGCNYKIKITFFKHNDRDNIYTLNIDPSLYLDKTILQRKDLTFENVEKAINNYLNKKEKIQKQIDEFYEIEVIEVDRFKTMKNPGWKD